jgi:tRNA U34 5-methylaminomethyl-2-thiouridine-forming methyltransferase MnmC
MNIEEDLIPQITADGSFTFFSSEFGETFHSCQGAQTEAHLKFVEPTKIHDIARKSKVKILDICYGLGYNSAAALDKIWAVNPDCQVELIGLELERNVTKFASEIVSNLVSNWWQNSQIIEILVQLAKTDEIKTDTLKAQLLINDARKTITAVKNSGFQADAIFLDPFSPPKCPQLWTVEFLNLVAQCLKPDGRLATYSCAAGVRSALLATGLKIGATTPVGRRSPGTVASFTATDLPPLSPQEKEHLQTRAAIPYRDPNLCDSAAEILQRRQIEQQFSTLEPTSRWKKRWQSIGKETVS